MLVFAKHCGCVDCQSHYVCDRSCWQLAIRFCVIVCWRYRFFWRCRQLCVVAICAWVGDGVAESHGLVEGRYDGSVWLFCIGQSCLHLHTGDVPQADVMEWFGFLALIANVSVAILLYYLSWRRCQHAVCLVMQPQWCYGNVAVMLAALGVFGTGQAWPDLLVAVVMALLGCQRQDKSLKRLLPS